MPEELGYFRSSPAASLGFSGQPTSTTPRKFPKIGHYLRYGFHVRRPIVPHTLHGLTAGKGYAPAACSIELLHHAEPHFRIR
jgi:hypothetical protein